jgi:hypothetical protein
MTAQHVNGHAVIADEPAVSPHLKDNSGRPVAWRQIRRLLMDDGSELYGCQHCDYTSPNMNSIRPHLGAHSTRPRKKKDAESALTAQPMNDWLRLLRQIEQLDKVCQERDDWKGRAMAAERSLSTLRRALNPGIPR